MESRIARVTVLAMSLFISSAQAQAPTGMGSEEFGMSMRQLVEAIEKVEGLISKCMRAQGFEYIAVDANTVRKGMGADKNLPGMSEKQFIRKYGYGIATTYTGQPPQLATGYSPAKVGLGARNVAIYKNLSAADQVAYNRALFGENPGATFAVGLEIEDFSQTGGCTRRAIEQVFEPDQLKATYYNPKDAQVNKHPRMKEALRKYAAEMRKAGFDYTHPDEIEPDIRERLNALTNGGTIPPEKLTAEQQAALTQLREHERRVAVKDLELVEKLIDPAEEKILEEMFARKPE